MKSNEFNLKKFISFTTGDTAKILMFFAAICLVIFVIFTRLGIFYFNNYFNKKPKNQLITKSSDDIRGSIISSTGEFLAISVKSRDLYIDPAIVIDKKQTIKIVAKYFPNINLSDFTKRLEKNRWILVEKFISQQKLQSLIQDGLIGIRLEKSKQRIYPDANLFSHIVGFTDIDENGLSGLEKYYDNQLYETDIQTSIIHGVQSIVRDELISSMQKNAAKNAFAIIMDVKSGEIISSVSLPDYNPNIKNTINNDNMRNINISSALDLGSVFKFFTLAFALENGLSADYKIRVKEGIRLEDGRIIRDEHNKKDELTLEEVFFKSSNVGAGIIATMHGGKKYIDFLQKLGVFTKLQLNIPDGEIAASIFDKKDFSTSRIVTTSYGYGVSMSPLHFLSIANAIVNDGRYVAPTFIKNGNIGKKSILLVSKSTSRQAIDISNKVITEGTAQLAKINAYKICGKTGTSNKFDFKTKSWSSEKKLVSFFAIFPCTEPRYVMYLGIDEPKPTATNGLVNYANLYGGNVAAPSAARIISVISPMLNIKVDKL